MRKISIFGSTGSVGQNALDLLRRQGGVDAYDVVALSGYSSVALLAKQAREFRADIAVIGDPSRLSDLRDALEGSGVDVVAGPEALVEAALRDCDWFLSAIVGAAGLAPTLAAAKSVRVLALANKESLVCAGELLKRTCAQFGTELLPVDSEHSAIFQALRGENTGEIAKITLTASGGPFRDWTRDQMADATLEQAVAHPNWDMGQRISIDSASMFNKALEVIETKELFGVGRDRLDVLVHPQSIIHSMVAFTDGAVIAQLGTPDMRGPIGFALNYPNRLELPVETLDLASIARLDFSQPDSVKFPAISLAYDVCEIGGYAGCVLNAAKEAALDGFVAGSIGFLDMAKLVTDVLNTLAGQMTCQPGQMNLDEILEFDRRARQMGHEWIMSQK